MLGNQNLPQLTALETQKADELLAVFEEQDDQGNYVHSDEEARHMLPALLIMAGVEPDSVQQPALKALFGEFRGKFQLGFEASLEEWEDAAVKYYEKHPPKKELLSKIQQVFG